MSDRDRLRSVPPLAHARGSDGIQPRPRRYDGMMKGSGRFAGYFAVVALAIAMAAGGCGLRAKPKGAAAYYAQAQTAGRAAAAAGMAADWRAKKLLLNDCINFAFERIDADGDTASLIFAGAVLDFAQLIEKELPREPEMELFWTRLGGLAGAAGEKAYNAGDIKLARSLVLAGPMRWQTEAYWMRHPNHDAIAAYVLFLSGEGGEAIRRLRSRPDLSPAQEQAMQDIQAGMRK